MNLPMSLPGLLVPPLTPSTADLGIDERALERQIDYIVTACTPGLPSVAAGLEALSGTAGARGSSADRGRG